MKNFNDLLSTGEYRCAIDHLKLLHTANGEDFKSIISDGLISPHSCNVFKPDKLSYFFLGRPGYKTSVVNDPSYWQLPAIFVLKKPAQLTPKRVFPFDSGALENERYRAIIGQIDRDEFSIPTTWEAISALVGFFFEDSDKYLKGKPVPYEEIDRRIGENASNFETLAVSKLYNFQFNDQIDDRSRLIELQFSEEIELNAQSLDGVIICNEWLRDPKIEKRLKELDARVETYPLYPLSSASYYTKIYELAELFA